MVCENMVRACTMVCSYGTCMYPGLFIWSVWSIYGTCTYLGLFRSLTETSE